MPHDHLVQALQFVSEEKLLSHSQLHPVQVMGVEGILSTLFSCVAIAIASQVPGSDARSAESWQDTVSQLDCSTPLLLLCLFQFLGVAGNNYFGLRVSGACPSPGHARRGTDGSVAFVPAQQTRAVTPRRPGT